MRIGLALQAAAEFSHTEKHEEAAGDAIDPQPHPLTKGVAENAGSANNEAPPDKRSERDAGDGRAGPQELVGAIAVADELRPAAAETVRRLQSMGLQRVVLLTGDNAATARSIAAKVGIADQDVFADLLPEDKERTVRELLARHKTVAMVGDGVNDAPALAAATVGIVMGTGGSDVALETADVALVADDLSKVPWVLELSHRAARTIKMNVALALGLKGVVLVLAALGIANLWLAIAADTGASVLVSMNGMRLLGRVQLPAAADVAALRRRYRLGEEEEHDHGAHGGHGHGGHAH